VNALLSWYLNTTYGAIYIKDFLNSFPPRPHPLYPFLTSSLNLSSPYISSQKGLHLEFFKNMSLYTPLNFSQVENDLYRSAVPTEVHYPFLQSLKIRTILLLNENPPTQLSLFAKKLGNIQLIVLENAINPVAEDMVVRCLQVIYSILFGHFFLSQQIVNKPFT
jgi:hypothetical protein